MKNQPAQHQPHRVVPIPGCRHEESGCSLGQCADCSVTVEVAVLVTTPCRGYDAEDES
ncbi:MULTISPECIES: hypothetical protein [Streptomyces]|uniref:Uncharacterized protein n=2 Tax=Streptomyces TaxID=1883 RepID=A0ABV9J770_9ACTN